MSWYRTGTVAVINGSKTVTGVGTLWTTAVNAGDAFALVDANLNPTGAWYEVESVTNNTTLVLKQSYAGSTGSNKQYCVFNLVGNMTTPSFAQRLATFFASFQNLIDKPTVTPTALGIPVADANGDIDSGWLKDASTTVKGVVELATPAEVLAGTAGKFPDAAGVHAYVDPVAAYEVGEYKTVQDDLAGATVPDPTFWVKLEAGLTGAGQYNEGKLTNETITGSAPLVEATAEIADPESPLFGQVIHLLETEERFFRAGQAGRVQNDQMQRIIGSAFFDSTNLSGTGAISRGATGANRTSLGSSTAGALVFNSANSPDARASSTTDGETRAKNIGVSVYMRIK
jgi:hypothetical protein